MDWEIKLINNCDSLIPENISKNFSQSPKLTIYNLHSTSVEFFPKYKSLLKKLKTLIILNSFHI